MISGTTLNRDPFKKAWMWSLRDLVVYYEPGGGWYMRPEAFWNLFYRNQGASWADELAWVASQHVTYLDECGLTCALQRIIDGPLQYWTLFPKGARVADAVQRAVQTANSLAESCKDAQPERLTTSAGLQPSIEQIRDSLDEVEVRAKRDLVEALNEVGRRCAR